MNAAAISVRNLVKRFPLSRGLAEIVCRPFTPRLATALDGLDLEVGYGEIFGLLGPNGAGKTTLLKILCTLVLPTEGVAAITGHDVVQAPASVRRAVGYCLDTERSFYYRLTGRQNLAFFGDAQQPRIEASRRPNRRADRDAGAEFGDRPAVYDLFERDAAEAWPGACADDRSGRSAAGRTDQEPRPGGRGRVSPLFRGTLVDRFGKTILLVTHSLEDASECCDRMALMNQGRISMRGTWAEVRGASATAAFPRNIRTPRDEEVVGLPEAGFLDRNQLPLLDDPSDQFDHIHVASYYYMARFVGGSRFSGGNVRAEDYFAFVLIGVAVHEYLTTSLDAFSPGHPRIASGRYAGRAALDPDLACSGHSVVRRLPVSLDVVCRGALSRAGDRESLERISRLEIWSAAD